ncbi:MAG: hypothetical protein JNM07_05435 [Phycisphaerae bacterium]|nr:hypothetical protein [Phycisphaerae bacterium]
MTLRFVATTGALALAMSVAAGRNATLLAALPEPPKGEARAARGATSVRTEDLPIRRITLYRSGVGYFQRDGLVDGNARVQLRFQTDQINDILKSLVLLDLGGGSIDAVSYASKEPLGRRLASFGVNIADNPSLADLLSRLRGAAVEVRNTDGTKLTGTILGVELRNVPGGKDSPPIATPFLSLVTDAGLAAVAIPSVASFNLLDKALNDELKRALAALAEYRADRTKTVDLGFSGSGTRDVVVAYVHETPVWKTSYRLVLADDAGDPKAAPASAAKSGAQVQGWAIVENTTDEDWTDVKLSLVSGRPVSFQMDLYEPLYLGRPMLAVPTIPGVMPRQYLAGVNLQLMEQMASAGRDITPMPQGAPGSAERAEAEGTSGYALQDKSLYRDDAGKDAFKRSASEGRKAGAPAPAIAAEKGGRLRVVLGEDMTQNAAAAMAQAAEVGEVFQYELKNTVTVERQRSAMIPILSSPIEARRVSIYNRADRADHPMRGVELRNGTAMQLLPGPLAVFDGAAYAGDAQIGHLPAGDKRLLAYAVDLETEVLTKDESTSDTRKMRIVDGMFELTVKSVNKLVYAFQNKDQKRPRTVVIEHPRLGGYTLSEPSKAVEETQEQYRFEITVAPGKTGSLPVAQEQVQYQRVAVMSFDLPTVLQFQKDGKLSQAVVDAVRKAAEKQSAVNAAERSIAELDRQIASINTDQQRLRENIKSIDKSSQLYSRYQQKLNEQETQLEEIGARRTGAQAALDAARKDLDDYLRKLNVE